MKILIVGTPKTGNVWIERLLGSIYDLPVVDMSGTNLLEIPPPRLTLPAFVAHQHYGRTPAILEWGRAEGVRFLTPLRHPGDVFISLHHYLNRFVEAHARAGIEPGGPPAALIGKPIDDPAAMHYLRTAFLPHVMRLSLDWLVSGDAIPVRYEDLRRDARGTLARLTSRLEPVKPERIDAAITENSFDRTRERDPHLKLHCRDGSSEQWRRELNREHIAIFNEQFGRELEILGYSFD